MSLCLMIIKDIYHLFGFLGIWRRRRNQNFLYPPASLSTLMVDQNTIDSHNIKEKITAALKDLSFRDRRVLVQFWSPATLRKHHLLTTLDQPFGLGVVDEGLYLYRSESERRMIVLDEVCYEKELGSPGRVYRQKFPEWSLDIPGLSTRQYVQDGAARSNIHGYISLPVFVVDRGCCVGVLELIAASTYVDYSFEVQEISRALKEENLKTSNAFEDPSFDVVPYKDRKNELAEIWNILEVVCKTHSLPLAHTWAVSPLGSYVYHEKTIQKSCSSFDSKCIGKICMSTNALPFYVQDKSKWRFHEACEEQHLERSRGCVGKALLSHGSCFCVDVTKLSEEEYPLVHNARMSGLTSCFAIFLHSVEHDNDYVLEFFLPLDVKDNAYIPDLVQTLKQNIKESSRFKVGDISYIEVGPPMEESSMSLNMKNIEDSAGFEVGDIPFKEDVGPPREERNMSLSMELDMSIQIANVSPSEMDSELVAEYVATIDSVCASSSKTMSTQKVRYNVKGVGKKNKKSARSKIHSLTLDVVQDQFGKTMDEAAQILGVSRSTLKRFCREQDISSWPMPKHKKTAFAVQSNSLLGNLEQATTAMEHHSDDDALLQDLGFFDLDMNLDSPIGK